MTKANDDQNDSPLRFLSQQRKLISRVHLAQRATWFPLTLLGLVTFLAIPIERLSHRKIGSCGSFVSQGNTATACRIYTVSGLYYWPIALVISYLVISRYFLNRSRELGVETRAHRYAYPGIALAFVLGFASYSIAHLSVGVHNILGLHLQDSSAGIFFRFLGPSCSIGIGLLFLAWFERNIALLVFDIFYLGVVLWPPSFKFHTHGFWSIAPYRMIDGGALVIAGLGFALYQRLVKADRHAK